MADIELVFKTRAELQGAKSVEDQLERDIGKAKALGKDFSDLEAQLKRVKSAIAAAGKPEGPGLGEMFSKIREGLGDIVPGFARLDGLVSKFAGGSLAAVAGGFTVAAGAIETAREALNEYAEQEANVARLDAALAQRAQLTDDYREKLQELAGQLQETTAIADEKWIAVLTRLTQFGADPENIEQYAEAVKNLAGLLGGDVESAANAFSRALQGNFDMFARYGIRVEEAGTQTERLDKLMVELAQRGGGQLEASANSLTGQWRQFANATADVSKGIGRMIASTGLVQGALSAVTSAFSWWSEVLSGVVPKIDGLENALRPTVETMNEGGDAAKKYAQGLEQLTKDGTTASAAVDAVIRKIRELRQLQDEQEDAEMGAQLAQVDEDEAKHKLVGSAAIQKRGDIRKEFAKKKFERGQAALQEEIQANEAAYAAKAEGVDEANAAVEKRREQLKLQQEIEQAAALVRTREESAGKAEQEYSKAQEERDLSEPSKFPIFTKGGKLDLPESPLPSWEEVQDKEQGRTPEGERVKDANAALAANLRLLQAARKKLADLQEVQQVNGGSTTLTAAQLEAQIKGELEPALKKKQSELEAEAERIKQNEVLKRRSEANAQIYPTQVRAGETTTSADVIKAKEAERHEMERKAEEFERKQQQERERQQREVEHDLQMRNQGLHGGHTWERETSDIGTKSSQAVQELGRTNALISKAFEDVTEAVRDLNAQLSDVRRDLALTNSRQSNART
jgi:hypothetical protein